MSSDIVERLRNAAVGMPQDDMNQTAADTIEARDAEIVRLRAAGDALDRAISGVSCGGTPEVMDALMKAHGQWLEARREQ